MQKSFSSIEIKSVQEDRREIEGIASTPTPDRVNDVVEPLGLTFQKEIPLLLNHKSDQPVGTVQFGTPTPNGLPFKAKIAKVGEEGEVKRRTDEAWHSVKSGLIKGVSIGFIARASEPLRNGGTRFTKADVHELSLTAIPANPEAKITGFKALDDTGKGASPTLDLSQLSPELAALYTAGLARREAEKKATEAARKEQETTNKKKENDMQKTNNIFIRSVIAKTVTGGVVQSAQAYASSRWGNNSDVVAVIKAEIGPMGAGADATGALTAGTLSRQQFVQAVFSNSILGQLAGLLRVPATCRVGVETVPIAAKFVGEFMPAPAYQGAFNVKLVDKRKVGLIAVMSRELLLATDNAAEDVVSTQLKRALSRGIDNYFVGSQARGEDAPAGLASVATPATGFNAGVEAFTGDLMTASILVNPRTAITLRSPTENAITAHGGEYGGLPAIASYAIPEGKMFIVDASRVLTYLGDVELDVAQPRTLLVDDGSGAMSHVSLDGFSTDRVAVKAMQYADWDFVDGAAVEVTL
ncbi:major capsid protein [Burkholderia ubonensis]|uniref:HK97 family phage prohead protease n=1 Tax=Burkholderia ubonensis TaxID=101571 RepID=UPI000760364B|nr:HK97 family phage prohead protease [Burkholderia ubonensis]KVX18524.1 major capsid protein [Burkholderia ubonensis]